MNTRVLAGWLSAAMLVTGQNLFAQGWSSPAPAGTPVSSSPQWSPQYGSPYPDQECPPELAGNSQIMAELLPSDRGLFEDSPSRLDLMFHENIRETFIRLEYLQAEVHRNEGQNLGAPLATVDDPSQQFDVLFTDGLTTGLAQVPDTRKIDWGNMPGIRGTLGIPIGDVGWIEARYWGFAQESDTIDIPTLPPLTLTGPLGTTNSTFLATTLTTNRQPGTRTILYDRSFFSDYKMDVWSSDVNYVHNLRVPQEGWTIQTILGYRHEEYGERLAFGGTFDNNSGFLDGVGVLATPQSNLIDSKVRNFRDQAQLGFRTEFEHRWFTLGAEPKLAFGTNVVRNRLVAENVREPGDPNIVLDPTNVIDDPAHTVTTDRAVIFAPTFDLGLYGKIKVKEWFHVRVGWDVMWMGNLGVADRSIRFNETSTLIDPDDPTAGSTSTADVIADRDTASRVITTFTIGGEIILP